jgi:hypothetical protein
MARIHLGLAPIDYPADLRSASSRARIAGRSEREARPGDIAVSVRFSRARQSEAGRWSSLRRDSDINRTDSFDGVRWCVVACLRCYSISIMIGIKDMAAVGGWEEWTTWL